MATTSTRAVTIFGTAALALLLGFALPAAAKNDGHKSHRNHDYRDHDRGHGNHKPGKAYKAIPPGHVKHHIRHEQWMHHRAKHWKHEHRPWHARGGYRGYVIPADRFHAHFGPSHWFRVHTVPVMIVESRPRFQFGGFWFSMVDPWPESWAPTWYETDDVYIDYVNDGYYMYNRRHPDIAIAVNVSF